LKLTKLFQFNFLQQPYAHRKNNIYGRILRDIGAGVPPAMRPDTLDLRSGKVWDLLESCWAKNITKRITMRDLLAGIVALERATSEVSAFSSLTRPFASSGISSVLDMNPQPRTTGQLSGRAPRPGFDPRPRHFRLPQSAPPIAVPKVHQPPVIPAARYLDSSDSSDNEDNKKDNVLNDGLDDDLDGGWDDRHDDRGRDDGQDDDLDDGLDDGHDDGLDDGRDDGQDNDLDDGLDDGLDDDSDDNSDDD
jgi:hypothetical protein